MSITLSASRLPDGYNTANPFLLVKGPGGAQNFIHFLGQVFDGVERADFRTPDRDGSILHAEVMVGNSSLLIADSKSEWPFTPSLQQVYVDDVDELLRRAEAAGAEVVTPHTPFYNGLTIARILDPWGNLWWIYGIAEAGGDAASDESTSWQDRDPSVVYSTLMDVMGRLRPKGA